MRTFEKLPPRYTRGEIIDQLKIVRQRFARHKKAQFYTPTLLPTPIGTCLLVIMILVYTSELVIKNDLGNIFRTYFPHPLNVVAPVVCQY